MAQAPEAVRHAAELLGLSASSELTLAQVKSRWRELQTKVHPDTGGSDALAAQVNAARDVLTEWLAGTWREPPKREPPQREHSRTTEDAKDRRQREEWEAYKRAQESAQKKKQRDEAPRPPDFADDTFYVPTYMWGARQRARTRWLIMTVLVVGGVAFFGRFGSATVEFFRDPPYSEDEGEIAICWPGHKWLDKGKLVIMSWPAYRNGRGPAAARENFEREGLAEHYAQREQQIQEVVLDTKHPVREAIHRGRAIQVSVPMSKYRKWIWDESRSVGYGSCPGMTDVELLYVENLKLHKGGQFSRERLR